jgi:hypothetical protein
MCLYNLSDPKQLPSRGIGWKVVYVSEANHATSWIPPIRRDFWRRFKRWYHPEQDRMLSIDNLSRYGYYMCGFHFFVNKSDADTYASALGDPSDGYQVVPCAYTDLIAAGVTSAMTLSAQPCFLDTLVAKRICVCHTIEEATQALNDDTILEHKEDT